MEVVRKIVGHQMDMFGGETPTTPEAVNMAQDAGSKEAKALYLQHEKFAMTRLSKNFIMRDFLYSTYNDVHGVCNYPEHPKVVIRAGEELCKRLLEPILEHFGRFAITYGYHNRAGMEAAYPNLAKASKRSSSPHQWDRQTFGHEVYARVDILPFCVEDGEVSKEEFAKWCMYNLDIDLFMMWHNTNVFCITIGPKPRRVWLEWVTYGKGEGGSNKITHMGEEYWLLKYPNTAPELQPKFGPSCTGGKMYWERK